MQILLQPARPPPGGRRSNRVSAEEFLARIGRTSQSQPVVDFEDLPPVEGVHPTIGMGGE